MMVSRKMRTRKENFLLHTTNVGEREREEKKNEKKKNYFDPHMVEVETATIINELSLKRDLHMYEVLPRFISNGKDLQTNA
jgi:hypothetical protein